MEEILAQLKQQVCIQRRMWTWIQRLFFQEAEVKELENQLYSRPEFQNNSKIDELRAENDKLNYRANILIRVRIARCRSTSELWRFPPF